MISVKVKAGKSPLGALRSLPKELRSAVQSARKDALSELKKSAVSETLQKYYLTKGQITKAMKSTSSGFKVSGGMLTLDEYKLTPKRPRKGYVLQYAVKKDTGLKQLERDIFLMKLPQVRNKYKPAIRKGKARLPVYVILRLSIPQAVGNEETVELLQEKADEIFTKKLNEALARLGAVK